MLGPRRVRIRGRRRRAVGGHGGRRGRREAQIGGAGAAWRRRGRRGACCCCARPSPWRNRSARAGRRLLRGLYELLWLKWWNLMNGSMELHAFSLSMPKWSALSLMCLTTLWQCCSSFGSTPNTSLPGYYWFKCCDNGKKLIKILHRCWFFTNIEKCNEK